MFESEASVHSRQSAAIEDALVALSVAIESDNMEPHADRLQSSIRDLCVMAHSEHATVESLVIDLHRIIQERHRPTTVATRERVSATVRSLIVTYYASAQ